MCLIYKVRGVAENGALGIYFQAVLSWALELSCQDVAPRLRNEDAFGELGASLQ